MLWFLILLGIGWRVKPYAINVIEWLRLEYRSRQANKDRDALIKVMELANKRSESFPRTRAQVEQMRGTPEERRVRQLERLAADEFVLSKQAARDVNKQEYFPPPCSQAVWEEFCKKVKER